MKRFHQLFLLSQAAFVVCMLSISLMQPVFAEDEQSKEPSQEHCQHNKEMFKKMQVHMDFYHELLAEKYAPNHTEEWHEIRKERDLLRKKINEAKKRGELVNEHKNEDFKAFFEKHKQLQVDFRDAVEKRDDEKIKQLLPQLFEQHRQMNEMLKKKLEGVN
ncbi:hypothetical protein [Halalkalibacter urbisdiaboli]|uniref:hypothetical protein n=1 Tax=Halalkalibacter urbisdiaboli TaxID=1960589 RepID=UPI000B45169E|nr:hypothetical protein [Halalkalibacter urbisdiaboli]